MDSSAREITEFSIVTNKPVSDIEGDRVWLITGEGRPRRFYLVAWFIADEAERWSGPRFGIRVFGEDGQFCDPMVELNSRDWFPDFKRSQGNFAFGLQRITNKRFVEGLEAAARA
jgi:hypothetical protein